MRSPPRAALTDPARATQGCDYGPADYRSLSRSGGTSLRPVDRGAARDPIAQRWGHPLRVDRGALLAALGVFSPDTTAAGVRAGSGGSPAVAGWEYPRIREGARRAHASTSWGEEAGMRSDHEAGRSRGRRGRTPGTPVWVQSDLDDHSPGAIGLHGVPPAVHGIGVPHVPATAPPARPPDPSS